MKQGVFVGKTWHTRFKPVRHHFEYVLHYFALDLSELEKTDGTTSFFGYNRFAPFSIWDRDYIEENDSPILEKLHALLASRNPKLKPARVILITMPRYFGYVFNPVSFYLCYSETGSFMGMVAEVRNTFGEVHTYVMEQTEEDTAPNYRFKFPKEFYVSPFFKVKGEYEVLLRDEELEFDVTINVIDEGERVFNARLAGESSDLTKINVVLTLLKFPLSAWLTMTRIHWHALKLYFFRKINFKKKPAPSSPNTWCRAKKGLAVFIREKVMNILITRKERAVTGQSD
ncbi:DUF1365 domain-containing protein [Oligoflexia bacterium]|nr:DUF1365 domain-containing protein [Oligoflexia bacterium]